MNQQLKKTVVLVGMMGAGKTAVGKAIASILGVPFLDSDEEITHAANRTISEIFERDGEQFFREKESQVISRLLDSQPGILSTGGGAFLVQANRQLIRDKGVSVWLRADLKLLWNRVKNKNTRPLLCTDDPKQTLTQLFEARVPDYSRADLVVDADAAYSIDDMARAVIGAMKTRADVMEPPE